MTELQDTQLNSHESDSRREIRHSITRYLAQREHGFNEIMQKLLAKSYDSHLCQEELIKFRDADLQSDQRFAESFMQRRIDKGYGERYVQAEAASKGLDADMISVVLEELAVDWQALAYTTAEHKFGEQPPATPKEHQKRHRFLLNRGFSAHQVLAVYPYQDFD